MTGIIGGALGRLSPRRLAPKNPKRILLLKPCCIGDVVLTTPLLTALRRGYPDAAIDWLVGTWSAGAVAAHPALARVIDGGPRANPASTLSGLFRLVRQMRRGQYDLLIAPERSPLISLAALLSGIPKRAGLDSAGRGFGYTVRAPIDPTTVRHEAEIYLDIARVLGLSTKGCWANIIPDNAARAQIERILATRVPTDAPLVIVHPGGGVNPGMVLTAKRWPPERFAELGKMVANSVNGHIIVLGSHDDLAVTRATIGAFDDSASAHLTDLTGQLTLPQIAALAALPRVALYIGNDNGIAHLAAAAGARLLMIFGPSDPRRYAPFVPPEKAAYVWRPVRVPDAGVVAGIDAAFDWERDGVSVAEAWGKARSLLGASHGAKPQ